MKVDNGKLYMQPTIQSLCGVGMPVHVNMKTISFPLNDRHDQCWTYYFDDLHITKDGQNKMYPCFWIFALTPHLPEEIY